MIDDAVRELAKDANFAALTTLLPDGQPSTQVMWVDCDDEHILVNTEVGRQKYANVEQDPRVAVSIVDKENPYRYAEVRGEVVETVKGPEARSHIDELSRKYRGEDYSDDFIQTERVIFRIRPDRQRVWG